ncbi:MAG: 30S ribosomal protein S6 [Bacteroidetes bacterium]|nr:30S ribosomal protein S6 [Bacteroidota bacterium]MBU2506036.1 30S ribosomal protein S6 [Bacteroidota bacterium]
MKTNHYECVIILNAALEDEHVNAVLKRFEDYLKANGGEVSAFENWGRKRLAYPIHKSKSGYYAVYRFVSPRELIVKLERTLRLDENVIRYLTVALEPKAVEHFANVKDQLAENPEDVLVENNSDEPIKTDDESVE